MYVWSEKWSGRPDAHSYWWISFLSASILACGVVGFEGYLPDPFGLSQPQPSTFRAWPRSVASSLPSRAGRVVLKDPGQRKGIICQCVFYMAVGIFGIIASRPGGRKNPFKLQNGLLLHFWNRCSCRHLIGCWLWAGDRLPGCHSYSKQEMPAAGKAWGFVPGLAGSFLTSTRELCPKPGQKIQRGASASFQAGAFVRPPRCFLCQITLVAEYQQMLYYCPSLPMPGCMRPARRCASQPLIPLGEGAALIWLWWRLTATRAFLGALSCVLCAALKKEKGEQRRGPSHGREPYPRYSPSLQCTPSVFYSDVHEGRFQASGM